MNVDDTKIISLLYTEKDKINKYRTRESWLKEHGLYEYICNRYNDFPNNRCYPAEIVYRIKNKIEHYPICPICGKKVTLRDTIVGYHKYCSPSCSMKDSSGLYKLKENIEEVTDQKVIDKCIVKTTGALCSKHTSVRWLREHGLYEYISKRYEDSSSISETIYRIVNNIEVHPKCKHCGKPLKYYGFTRGFESNYCIACYAKSREYKDKIIKEAEERYKKIGLEVKIVKEDTSMAYVYGICNKHNPFVIKREEIYRAYKRNMIENRVNFCPICSLNSLEASMQRILEDLELSNVIRHSRKIIKPTHGTREIDFYLKDFNIGYECNGIYWHQGLEAKDEISEKLNLAESKSITLYNFWENELKWFYDNVKNLIGQHTLSLRKCIDFKDIYFISSNIKLKQEEFFNINEDITLSLNNSIDNILMKYKEETIGVIEVRIVSSFSAKVRVFFRKEVCIKDFSIDKAIRVLKEIKSLKTVSIVENFDICKLQSNDGNCIKEYQKALYFVNDKEKVSEEEFKNTNYNGMICYNSRIRELIF